MLANSTESATTHVSDTAGKRLPRVFGFNVTPCGSVTLAVLDHRCDVRSKDAKPPEAVPSRQPASSGCGTSLALQSIRLRGFLVHEYQSVATLFEILVVVGDQL